MAYPWTNLLDTFNRGDEGPPPGLYWDSGIRNGDESLIVSSNECRVDATGGPDFGACWYTQTEATANWCEAYVTISWLPSTGNSVEVLARVRDPATAAVDGYAVRYSNTGGHGGGAVYIYRIDNDVYTQIASQIVLFANGDGLGIRCNGSSITAWRKTGGAWVQQTSAVDATYPDAGLIGLAVNNNDTSIRFDDFGGGPFPAAGGVGGGSGMISWKETSRRFSAATGRGFAVAGNGASRMLGMHLLLLLPLVWPLAFAPSMSPKKAA